MKIRSKEAFPFPPSCSPACEIQARTQRQYKIPTINPKKHYYLNCQGTTQPGLIEELYLLYEALSEVMIQGKKMNIEYYDELDYLCKKKLGLQLLKMDIFKL